jgi:hypothetical protein
MVRRAPLALFLSSSEFLFRSDEYKAGWQERIAALSTRRRDRAVATEEGRGFSRVGRGVSF